MKPACKSRRRHATGGGSPAGGPLPRTGRLTYSPPSGIHPSRAPPLSKATMSYSEHQLANDVDSFCQFRAPCAAIVARLDDPSDPADPGVQLVTHTTKELTTEHVMSLLMALKMGYQLVAQSVADQTNTNVHTLDERVEAMISAARPRFDRR
jgi:hypothetical protein